MKDNLLTLGVYTIAKGELIKWVLSTFCGKKGLFFLFLLLRNWVEIVLVSLDLLHRILYFTSSSLQYLLSDGRYQRNFHRFAHSTVSCTAPGCRKLFASWN